MTEGLFDYASRNPAPFQKHSSTSMAAAFKVNSKEQSAEVLKFIEECGNNGAITDEVRCHLLALGKINENSVMSARVRFLELEGKIIKTTEERKTSANRNANVYVTAEVFSKGLHTAEVMKDHKDTAPQRGYKAKWKTYEEWHEDYGHVVWHILPVQEPAVISSPLSSDWPYDLENLSLLRWTECPAPPER